MAGVEDNLPEIERMLRDLGEGFRFDLPGVGGSIGAEMLGAIASDIVDRTVVDQKSPGGGDLAELRPSTLEAKRRRGQPPIIGVATGEMLSQLEVQGTTSVTAEEASMEYGTNQDARDKAQWFTAGRENQAARPFYAIDEGTEARVLEVAEAHLARFVRGLD